MGEVYEKVKTAASYLQDKSPVNPEYGLILGSGLGELAESVSDPFSVEYGNIPGFQESTVEGHAGKLVLGRLEGKPVCMMQGRYHFYEGYDPADLVFPVRAMWGMGIETLLVTNASGGINDSFDVGDLVLIEDHINALGTNPLIGPNDGEIGPRFVDMTYAYDPNLRDRALDCAQSQDIDLKKGVYLATTGPSYETPAEIEMYDTIGADLVGMSTVPEVIAANHCGIDVLGISCVTNMAAGVLDQPLDHEEVIETTERVKDEFKTLVRTILRSF